MGDPVTKVSSQTGGLSQRQAITFYLVSPGRSGHGHVLAGPGGLGLGWCALHALVCNSNSPSPWLSQRTDPGDAFAVLLFTCLVEKGLGEGGAPPTS